jgi:hypothetical protein
MIIKARSATGEEEDGRDPAASGLAAIVFDRDEEPDPPLIAFIEQAVRRGVRVAGLVQERQERSVEGSCERHEVRLRDLATGRTTPIMQDLGREATGCRVDPAAIAVAAKFLDIARESAPDLLVANRFGRLEAEGGGMLAEIGRAVAEGVPLIVCVPARYLAAWDAFACGLDAKLTPTREAIECWWAACGSADSRRAA